MKKTLCIFLLAFCVAGCGQIDEKYTSRHAEKPPNVLQIEQLLDKHPDIDHANILQEQEQIIVALQIKPWMKWKKQRIEKEVEKEMKKQFPEADVTVSTDFKIHWEAGKLMEKKESEDIKSSMKQLRDLAKEET